MKNIGIIGLIILLMGAHTALGQVENRFSIGPRLGVNFANINVDADSRTGLTAGITSTYSINESSGVSVDVLYSQEGYERGNTDYKVDYIRVPVFYNLFFGNLGEAFRPKIYAGIAPGFLMSAEQNNADVQAQYKSTVIDLAGGLGFHYRLANRVWLNTDLRAFLGLNPMANNQDVKNRTIQLSLGIAYGL